MGNPKLVLKNLDHASLASPPLHARAGKEDTRAKVSYLSNCGGVIDGTYYFNALTARALFTEQELVDAGAVWNGRCWVGLRRERV